MIRQRTYTIYWMQITRSSSLPVPWVLYRMKRVPMGVTIASAETNNELRQALAGLEGVEQIQDDILIHGKNKQHNERLA